jgi:hypothetical protein
MAGHGLFKGVHQEPLESERQWRWAACIAASSSLTANFNREQQSTPMRKRAHLPNGPDLLRTSRPQRFGQFGRSAATRAAAEAYHEAAA